MGQYLGEGWDEDKIRVCAVQIATEMVGLGADSQVYRDMCWPGDTPQHQREMAHRQSACALLCGGVMRCLGVRHRLLEPPYYGRTDAMSRIIQIAIDHGAWDGADSRPEAGDIAIIGTDASKKDPHYAEIIKTWGTPGHALLCTNVVVDRTAGVTRIESVDGGRQPVKESSRTIKRFGNELWLAGWTTRRVYGVIRVGELKIPEDVPWCLPIRLAA
jgi:hypothetical protein